MYLSMVPELARVMFVMGVMYLFMSLPKPCGSVLYCSDMGVKPLMSENRYVMVLVSPPSLSNSGFFCRRFTKPGAM